MGIKTNVVNVELVEQISISDIPDGEYIGLWGGYEVTMELQDKKFIMKVDNVFRAINAPCLIIVNGNTITVEAQ